MTTLPRPNTLSSELSPILTQSAKGDGGSISQIVSLLPVICWDAPLSTVHLLNSEELPYIRSIARFRSPSFHGSSFVSNNDLRNPNRPMIIITIRGTNIFSKNMTMSRFHKNIRGVIFSGKVIVSGIATRCLTTHNGVGLLFLSHLPLLNKDNIFGRGSRLLLL